MPNDWLPSLITSTRQDSYAPPVLLSRMAVKLIQSDAAFREKLRSEYEVDADALIAVPHVAATQFSTIAATNNYWRNIQ
ncbi:MAG: hexameric tyrosine-coordinated heme protein [Litoreibacter sp.]|uniref:hexameric tyrosine-coordinated heme protein n=1 Tax=Litoreibacter sp. TaxID=1969459 RepID=UPI00329781D9